MAATTKRFVAKNGLDNNSNTLVNLATPVNSTDAATKAYVDSVVAGKDNTDEITEGSTNLYFTTARARSSVSAGTGISYNSSTGVISTSAIPNASLANSSVTVGTTAISLGGSSTTLAGLTSVTSTSFVGALTGNASTVTNGVYTTDTGTVTNTMLAGSIANSKLLNSSITINGTTISLGGAGSITTANIAEAGNLYYTDARARAAVSAGTGISYNSTTGVITNSDLGSSQNIFKNFTDGTTTAAADSNNDTFKFRGSNGVTVAVSSDDATHGDSLLVSLSSVPNSSLANSSITINGATISLGGAGSITTSAITEGSNLYYTDTRARAALSGGTGVTYNSSTGAISIGQAVGTTSNVTFNDVTVSGNLIVNGTTTTINATTLDVADLNITVAKNASTAAAANGAGLTVNGPTTAATLTYSSADDRWNFNKNLNVGTVYGALVGNADTATSAGKWTTARTLSFTGDATGSGSVDGSANVATALTLANSGVTAGTYNNVTVDAKGRVTSGSNTAYLTSYTETSTLANVTARGATTATAISLTNTTASSSTSTGALVVSGGVGVAGNVNAGGQVNATGAMYAGSIVQGTGLNATQGTLTLFDATTPTSFFTIDAGTYASSGTVYYKNATHSFTGTISGTLSGNASTASKWATARTLSLTGDATGSMSVDGSANASAALTLANSGVTAGTYSSVTVDAKGRVTGGTNPGYLTSYTETDTLATVTARGATTTAALSTGALTVSGAITATGEVTAYYSDLRLKTNIVPIADALEKVEAINGVTFDPNEAALALGIDDRHQMGVIAQEIEAVAPELVCDSAFAGYKTVRYDKLTALLIEAVKELSAKVKTLEAQLGNTKPTL